MYSAIGSFWSVGVCLDSFLLFLEWGRSLSLLHNFSKLYWLGFSRGADSLWSAGWQYQGHWPQPCQWLVLKICWANTKVRLYGGLLYETFQSVYSFGEVTVISESFTHIDSIFRKALHTLIAFFTNSECCQEVFRRIDRTYRVVDTFVDHIFVSSDLVLTLMLFFCNTWTPKSDLRSQFDS